MGFVLLGLIIASIPFVLPIAGWVSARRTRSRVTLLEQAVLEQADQIERLSAQLRELQRSGGTVAPASSAAPDAATPQVPASVTAAAPAAAEPIPPVEPVPPVATPAPAEPLPPLGTLEPAAQAVPLEPQMETSVPVAPLATEQVQEQVQEQTPAEVEGQIPETVAASVDVGETAPPAGGVPPVSPPQEPPPPPSPGFDWESLIGVKLFAGIAGIALVLAAVFFLRYSIDQGWLQSPVRVAIGVIVAVALLVLCELKAAREYPATANALDGAAIAILFATFFAAHALWSLIPALATFILLGVVTALAVLLSIRRASLFIAILGLLGGFATPALLSTGENRPIPLFAYLLLLNLGLSWVAYRQVWPVLTWLTLGLTTVYQWVWVMKFLDQSSLSLAMGVFIVFPLATAVALTLGRRGGRGSGGAQSFERSALISAALPLLFAGYLASVPAYGAHATLLLGFLLLIDAGLLAIALARSQPTLHGVGGIATLVVLGVWLATSYVPVAGARAGLGFPLAFAALFAAAPAIARRFDRPFIGPALRLVLFASLVLFVYPVLAGMEPSVERPLLLFAALLAGVLLTSWRAVAEPSGGLFFIASFFAIATEAVWSAGYLTDARLRTAVLIYTAFGVVSMVVPVLARRVGKPLQPRWGSGAVLIVSLCLVGFVSLGPVSLAALWAMALLLAIMNAALFIEAAGGGLPRVSQIGSLLSWALLGLWWMRSAGSVGVLASLAVMTGLALITLGGHAWAHRRVAVEGDVEPTARATFGQGLYLALVGHVFLILIAANREWSLPPWPIFGSLAVMTLATSATSLGTRTPSLHAAGVVGAALVVASWAGAAGSPAWGLTVVLAAAVVSVYALAWMRLEAELAAAAACVVLFVSEVAVQSAVATGARPAFWAELAGRVLPIVGILALTAARQWKFVAIAAIVPAWLAVAQLQTLPGTPDWRELLILAGALYAVFAAYPIVLGARARQSRDPYFAAVLASAMFFFAGRQAFELAGLGWAVGAVPVGIAVVLAVLLRRLLSLEPAGARDIGRLALVAGAAMAFVTVAIPLQLRHQWITIGWALEGAALAWLYSRIPHRGLFYASTALLGVVFVRLALNPEILLYEPRGTLRILNWYLYTYLLCAASMFLAARWMAGTEDRLLKALPRVSTVLPAAGAILLFLLLNIEIADYYSTGPTITFRFGTTVSQDLTYTIGWLAFGMLLLGAGIYARRRPARIAAIALIAVTTLKAFLYDLASLEGLYRVGSFVGLALSLVLVSLVLKKYAVAKPKDA